MLWSVTYWNAVQLTKVTEWFESLNDANNYIKDNGLQCRPIMHPFSEDHANEIIRKKVKE